MVRLVHKDAPGFYEPQNEDQEAIFRSQGWTDEKPATKTTRKTAQKKTARPRRTTKSSEPASASGSSKSDGSSPADTDKETP
jgi:hypothetical protein